MYRNILRTSATCFVAIVFTASPLRAQDHDESNAVEGGGISVDGWNGQIDSQEAARGSALENAKLSEENGVFHVTTGPAVVYWKTGNETSGNYTVMATFDEPEYRTLSNHPHPYGIFIGGNDMGTEEQSLLYCAAYGSGKFIVRGFGPDAFQMNGRRGEENDVINKAADVGEPVSQAIALTVSDDKVECSINGTVVASYSKSDLIGEGKLKSTDGVYGFRFGHNTAGTVTGFHSTN